MGYYTKFDLNHDGNDPKIEEAINAHKELSCIEEAIKWYGHENDMKEFSKQFPTVLFTLRCQGEESDNLSIKYFRNGKMQVCKAIFTFPSFDESKLQ